MPKTLHTIQDFLLGREDITFSLQYKEDGSYLLEVTLPTRPATIKGTNLEDLTNKVIKSLRDAVILQGSDIVVRTLGAVLGILPYVGEEIEEALQELKADVLSAVKQPADLLSNPMFLDTTTPSQSLDRDNAALALFASLLTSGTLGEFVVH